MCALFSYVLVTQILERPQGLFAHKQDTLSYWFVVYLTIFYQLSGLIVFVGNMFMNNQVNPEFAAETLVLQLRIQEGLQFQKSSTKPAIFSEVFFPRNSSQYFQLNSDVASHMDTQPRLFISLRFVIR
jgi:hypothetical protein